MQLCADVHEALHAVHTNYISLWQDNAVPWKEPVFRGDSHLGSMVPSYDSEVSVSPACLTTFLPTPPELWAFPATLPHNAVSSPVGFIQ